MPPLVLHKGQRVQANWSDSMPHFIKLAATSKGYITKHQFHQYGIRFVQYLAKIGRLDQPHLLIVDSHKSHVYNLAFFDEMKENNIHVMAIPPHTSERSHNLQLTVLHMSLKLPHFAHHNVVPSLISRVQLCCIQHRMHGYSLISRANYRLVSYVQGARLITVTAGPVQVQYKISCFTVFALLQ